MVIDYVNGNPVNFVDPSGFSATNPLDPNCNAWPRFLADDCDRANGGDLNARESIYEQIVGITGFAGNLDSGWRWASFMLNHFLNGQGAGLGISLGSNHPFAQDEGITRATSVWREPKYPGDEPDDIVPLLHAFINQLPFDDNCNALVIENFSLDGVDHYFGKDPNQTYGTEPRPYNRGYWGAFGHVVIDGDFSATVRSDSMFGDGYMIEYRANYSISDEYAWFSNKATPLPVYGSIGAQIPHSWAISLENAGRASSYPFTISWTEESWAWISKDKSVFVNDGYLSQLHAYPRKGFQNYNNNN